ncbi:MAG: methyl-accepting chemotaxis protein [Caryophanon sp.]|nr:methyl-accepting chemotaxis protein [Caryophanon sp.]
MNAIEAKALDTTIQFYVEQAATIKQLFNDDVEIVVTDRNKVLEQIQSAEIPIESSKGRTLQPNEPLMQVMRSKKPQVMYIPKELYGAPLIATMIPFRNKAGEVVGGLAISRSTSKQTTLTEVAQQFAQSSEEIATSTTELAASSSNFMEYMNDLSNSQHEMSVQVEETTKILQMINSVAKNTRVLGFNAGIEAARAGEYGRGFGVVAKEITRLADQSAESVSDIHQLLQELNSKVENVVNIVNGAIDLSSNQSSIIHEIAESIQTLTAGAEEIEKLAQKM